MPLGFAAEQESARQILASLRQIADDLEKLLALPANHDGPRYPELRDVAASFEAAAKIMDAGVKARSLSPGQVAEVGHLFERAGGDLTKSGRRRA